MLRRTCAYNCPKGSPIRYGEVVGRGMASTRAPMRFARCRRCAPSWPSRRTPKKSEGHYFYITGEEHRVIRLDAVILSFPLE